MATNDPETKNSATPTPSSESGTVSPTDASQPPSGSVAAQEIDEHQSRGDGRKRERQREQEDRRRAHARRAARQVVARGNAEQRRDERRARRGDGRDPERIAARGGKGFQRLRRRQSRNHREHRRDDRGEQRQRRDQEKWGPAADASCRKLHQRIAQSVPMGASFVKIVVVARCAARSTCSRSAVGVGVRGGHAAA